MSRTNSRGWRGVVGWMALGLMPLLAGCDTTAPKLPATIASGALDCHTAALIWTPSVDGGGAGVEGYRVYRAGTFLREVMSPDTWLLDNMAGGTSNWYAMVAVDRAGNTSNVTAPIWITTPACPDNSPPSVPTGLSANASSCRRIDLSWNPSSDASGIGAYRVYRDGAMLTQVSAPATSLSDTGVAPSSTHTYAVSAVDMRGNESARGAGVQEATPACPDTAKPSVPAGLSATARSCSQIDLSWSAATDTGGSGLRGYKIYRSGSLLKQVTAPATSTSDGSLAASTNYAYAVSAIDNAGNESSAGPTTLANTPACSTPPTKAAPWARAIGSTSSESAYAVTVDTSGNVLIAGYFYGTADFGRDTLTSAGTSDMFVAKYSSTGAPLWAKRFGSTGSDAAQAIAVDGAGNVVIAGYFHGTVDFGVARITSAGSSDAFLAKLSSSGAPLWVKRFGDTGDDYAYGVALDAGGNVFLTGFFQGSVSFGGTTFASVYDGIDSFVAKYSPSGAHIWSRTFDNDGTDIAYGVAVDRAGDIALTGYFTNDINFGGSWLTAENGQADAFLAKLSGADGSHRWSKRFGDPMWSDIGYAVTTDAANNVIVAGAFQGTADFGGGSYVSAGREDAFIAKYSPNGGHIWSKHIGSTGSELAQGVTTDASGNVIVVGSFQRTVDFGVGTDPTSAGFGDIFVLKLSPTGSPLSVRAAGGTSEDRGLGVAASSAGNILVVGSFVDSMNLGAALTGEGGADAFVANVE